MSTAVETRRKPKGAVEDTGSNKKYLVVKHHRICEESKTPREGFKPIEVKNPKTGDVITKFIKSYRAIEGYIDKIEWYDTGDSYEQQYTGWKLKIVAGDQIYQLDLPFEQRASMRFMQTAENLDFTDFVEFRAWHNTKEGKDETAIAFFQNDVSVPQVYSAANPGDCPVPQFRLVAGKKKWNWDETLAFLYTRMMENVIPLVEQCAYDRNKSTQNEDAYPLPEFAGPPDDDIPF